MGLVVGGSHDVGVTVRVDASALGSRLNCGIAAAIVIRRELVQSIIGGTDRVHSLAQKEGRPGSAAEGRRRTVIHG